MRPAGDEEEASERMGLGAWSAGLRATPPPPYIAQSLRKKDFRSGLRVLLHR